MGPGVQALARQLFSFQIPVGGSEMGNAYMQAFVDAEAGTKGVPYQPGESTRLPNRYYRFRYGNADFFALDSNTLEAPPPNADLERERKEAAQHVRELEARARTISDEI